LWCQSLYGSSDPILPKPLEALFQVPLQYPVFTTENRVERGSKETRSSIEPQIHRAARRSALDPLELFFRKSTKISDFTFSLFSSSRLVCGLFRACFHAVSRAPLAVMERSRQTRPRSSKREKRRVERSAGAMPFAHARESRRTTMPDGVEDPPGGPPPRPPRVWVHSPHGIFHDFEIGAKGVRLHRPDM
jgi:hypothetical protein